MKKFNENMEVRRNQPVKPDDDIDYFVKSLGADIRKLGEEEQHLARNEIRQVVFKYQMMRFQKRRQPVPESLGSPSISQQDRSSTPGPYLSEVLDMPYHSIPEPR